MKPGIALHLTLVIVCTAAPGQAAEPRQDAQVRAIIEGGPLALVILGGAHDLTDNVRKLAGRAGEYVRVTTRWGRRFGVEGAE